MKNNSLGVMAALMLASACTHPTDAQSTAASPTPPSASFSASPATEIAKQEIANDAVVIDVRTASEFAEGHLPGAQLVPVQEMPARLKDIQEMVKGDLSRPIVVYCRSGGRATRAAQMLHDAGFQNVTNGGGLRDLQAK